jgi:hypothetical protein
MTNLSQLPFWVNSGIFTANDFRRMLDIEYISELAVALLFGPQNKKALLDEYYASFEEEFLTGSASSKHSAPFSLN